MGFELCSLTRKGSVSKLGISQLLNDRCPEGRLNFGLGDVQVGRDSVRKSPLEAPFSLMLFFEYDSKMEGEHEGPSLNMAQNEKLVNKNVPIQNKKSENMTRS